jgi:hypothetical protein
MKARSALVVICLIAIGLGSTTAPAGAAFHLTKVTEVFAGQLLQPNADFVELQMYQSGQVVLNSHKLSLYAANGSATECTIPQNVPNGANQAHILFATAEAQTAFGTADFTIPAPLIDPAGGAVCFGLGVDCVTWGSFSGSVTDDKGAVTNPEAAIPSDQSIHRSLGADAMLQATDDTNNSANDFAPAAESATSNGPLNLGSLTCTPGGGGGEKDTKVPSSEITAPKHKTAITKSESTNFQGTASDQGGSQLAKVEVALRQKIKGDGCKWWNGSKFAAGSCGTKVFQTATGDKKWSYDLPRPLKPTGRKVKNYRLYSRATDGDGNVETLFEAGRNLVKFEVYKPPIVCSPGPC